MNWPGIRREGRLVGALRRDRKGLLLSTALSAGVIAVVALPARAQIPANTRPQGGVVVAGAASISASPSITTVTQSSARAAVNWQSFNVGAAQSVDFVQPSASAVTLNRVITPDPSVIAGHIHANGGIVITNQSGVVFTHGSEVDAASVLVSAPGISNRNFMAGRMQFDIPAKPGARVVNAGHISVRQAGLAALVAPEVANSGLITAKLGHVVLAGGVAAATLDLYGDGLVSLDVTRDARTVPEVNGKQATALVTNTGTIVADGGTVELTARQADGLVQDLVDAGGTIAANSVGGRNGTIAITGIGGSIRIPGTLLAEGKAPGTTGGAIALDATGTVTLAGSARIDASGAAGGGTVAIGTTLARARGGPGTPATLTANAVSIAPRARIEASATDNGEGGRVTVLSLGSTAMAGTIRARGGRLGGNGGSVEISGENLSLDGGVDTSAPLGANGSILLDPYNLTIVPTGTSDTDVSSTGVAFSAGGTATGDTDTVSASAIEALTGNVTLQAINNLEIATNLKLTKVDQSLTLEAGNNLTIDSGFIVSTTGATGNIVMDAASAASPSPITTGSITINGTVSAGGALTLSAGTGGISIPGSIGGSALSLSTGGAIVVGGTAAASSGGNLSLSAGNGGIIINGSVSGHAVTLTTTGGAFDSSGTISATTLSGTTGNGASLTSVNNSIGTLATFNSSAGGTFNLADKSPLTVTGKVSVPNGGFLAIEADTLNVKGGTLSAPSGTVQLAPLTSGNTIALIETGGVGAKTLAITKADLKGVSASVLQIGTPDGGPIILGNSGDNISIPHASTLLLVSGSSVTEPGALTIGELRGVVGSATLDSTSNAIATLGNFTDSSGGFSLTESKGQPLLVAGAVSAPNGHTIALTADGIALGAAGSLIASGGTVTLAPAKSGLALDLTTGIAAASVGTFSLGDATPDTAAITAATLAVGASTASGLTITGPIRLPDIDLLDLMSAGAVSETTADNLSVGTLAANVASANLIGNNAIGTLGAITATGGFTLTDTEDLMLAGLLDAGISGTVQLNDAGFAISEEGGSITAGLFTGSGASASLGAANAIGTLGAFPATSGGFSLVEAPGQDLLVSGEVSVPNGQSIALTVDGIALGAAGSLSAPGGTVTLASAKSGLALDLTTGPNVASVGTFSLGDTSPDTAAITAGTLSIGAIGAGQLTITGSIALPDVALLDLLSSGALSETIADGLSVGTLAATVLTAGLIGSNAIGTLGAITAPVGFALKDTQNLTLAGLLDASTNLVQLNDPGFSIIEQTGPPAGSITAVTLTGSSLSATLTGANQIGTLGAFAASNGFSLTDHQALSITGALNTGAGPVTLTINGGNLVEAGSGAIVADTLTGSAASVALDYSNSVGTLGAFTSGGSFSFVDTAGPRLDVTGAVSVPSGQTIALTTDGLAIINDGISHFGSLSAPGGHVTLTPQSPDVPIALLESEPKSAGTLSINDTDLGLISTATLQIGAAGAGPILIGNPGDVITIPNAVTSLILESAGAITENGSLSAPAATLSGFATSASLPALGNNIGALGTFTTTRGFALTNAGNLLLSGPLYAGAAIADLTSVHGSIQEEAGPPAGTITSGTLAANAAGSIVLSEANSIGTLGAITAPGGFTLDNPAGFLIAGHVNAAGATVRLTSAGAAVENGGSITAGVLTGSLDSATLGGANDISEIAALVAHGGFSLTNEAQLAISGAVDIGHAAASFAIIGASLLETGAGVLTAGLIEGSAAGVSLSNSTNAIGTLGAFSAPGGLQLATANGLVISGVVSTGASAIDLTAGGGLNEIGGGTLIGAELLGYAGGGTLRGTVGTAAFTNTNTVTSLGAFTALGGFTLADAGSLALLGPLNAGTATVVLTGGAVVSEPSGSINAATLSGTLASAALDGANTIADLANFAASGGFSLTDLEALTLTGPVNAGSSPAAFAVSGALAESPSGVLMAGTLAGSAALITLADAANAISSLGAITAPGGLTLATTTNLAIGGSVNTSSSTILLNAAGVISESAGGTLISGALTGSARAASFANSNSIAELGIFTALGGFTLDSAADLPIAGPLDVGASTALLVAGGSLYETKATILDEITVGSITAGTLTGHAGNVALVSSHENLIANLGSFTAGAFNLDDGENLAVIGTVAGNPIGLTVNGNLALGGAAGSGVLASSGAVFLTVSGAVTEPAGAIDAAILAGSAASASLGAANLLPLLGVFTTTGPFLLNSAEPALTVNGPLAASSANLASAGNLILAGAVDAGSVALSAVGTISQSGGLIDSNVLSGSAAAAALPEANQIATLGAFATPGAFLLTDTASLDVAGPLSASQFALTDAGNVTFTGETGVGTLSLNVAGSVTEPSGSVTAALLSGSAANLVQLGPDAPAGSASIASLGSFSVANNGTFSLTDSEGLAIKGPFAASYFAIAAPGSVVLDGASITTLGLPPAEQSAADPARPGSYFDVTTSGGTFAALGTTSFNPDGATGTIRIQLPATGGGTVSFTNLVAPTTTVILDTGAASIIGTIDVAGLIVLSNGGSATLTGMIGDLSGIVASSKATISPFQSAKYRFNSCPLMSINCIFITPEQIPQGNPLAGLSIISLPPDNSNIDLLIPNVAYRDY